MTEPQLLKVIREFKKNRCKNLNFEKCKELAQGYKSALNARGCTSCAKRRARSKYGNLVRKEVKDGDFSEIFPSAENN